MGGGGVGEREDGEGRRRRGAARGRDASQGARRRPAWVGTYGVSDGEDDGVEAAELGLVLGREVPERHLREPPSVVVVVVAPHDDAPGARRSVMQRGETTVRT